MIPFFISTLLATQRFDYFGRVVNRAARVSGVPDGGQLVLSEEAFAELGPNYSIDLNEPAVRELGTFRLKGLDEPMKLIEMLPRSLAARHFPLPPPPPIEPPSGALVLLFSDVQGSTTQWEMHADIMSKSLDLHNFLIREQLQVYEGYEVKTEGDAFMVAFQDPRKALRCALDIQLQLNRCTTWPKGMEKHKDAAVLKDDSGNLIFRGLRVRIGMRKKEN